MHCLLNIYEPRQMYETMNEDSYNHYQQSIEDESIRNKRLRVENFFGLDFLIYLLEGELQSFKEAMNSPKCPF